MAGLTDRRAFTDRLRQIRREVYGEEGITQLAQALGVPPRTWENYEAGVTLPDLILLEFVCLTGVDVHWLAKGEEGGVLGASQVSRRGINEGASHAPEVKATRPG